MKQLKDIDMTPEWHKLVYSEAWKQYCYEDNIGVIRTTHRTSLDFQDGRH